MLSNASNAGSSFCVFGAKIFTSLTYTHTIHLHKYSIRIILKRRKLENYAVLNCNDNKDLTTNGKILQHSLLASFSP